MRIAFGAPFPWREMQAYLSLRSTPTFETIDGDRYARGALSVACDEGALVVTGGDAIACARVAAMFDVDYDPRAAKRVLSRDPALAARMERVPGFRPLGAWSPFELCVRTIIGQQVSVAGARTLMARLVERAGAVPSRAVSSRARTALSLPAIPELTAESVARADLDAIGMPGARARAIRRFAEAVADDAIDFSRPWPEVDASLKALPGFGPWTRGYLGIRLGRDRDAFPEADLGLIRAAGASSPRDLLKRAEAWRPYRAIAATYLWAVEPSR